MGRASISYIYVAIDVKKKVFLRWFSVMHAMSILLRDKNSIIVLHYEHSYTNIEHIIKMYINVSFPLSKNLKLKTIFKFINYFVSNLLFLLVTNLKYLS